jgi:hypothetical protein
VIGCIAWLTNTKIIQALRKVDQGVQIIVQKEDFLRPDSVTFNKKQTTEYIQRMIIDSSFAWLKQFPKMNCYYEKNISSFYGFVLIGCYYIILNNI